MAALAEPPRKTWTRSEIDVLEASGVLAGAKFELIDGEIFDKMGQNPQHASAVCRLAAILIAIFGAHRVRTQLPVEPAVAEASRSLPEPDVAVTCDAEPAYRDRHPGPSDILLIAEVADATYDYDVKRKGRLYARSAFAEYIVVDLNRQQMLVFGAPRDGAYTVTRVLQPGEVFYPSAAPEAAIPVASLFAS